MLTSAISLVESLAMLLSSAKLWKLAGSFVEKPGPVSSTVAFLILSYALGLVTSIPIDYFVRQVPPSHALRNSS